MKTKPEPPAVVRRALALDKDARAVKDVGGRWWIQPPLPLPEQPDAEDERGLDE